VPEPKEKEDAQQESGSGVGKRPQLIHAHLLGYEGGAPEKGSGEKQQVAAHLHSEVSFSKR